MKQISVMAGSSLPRLIGLRLSGLISAESYRPREALALHWTLLGAVIAALLLAEIGASAAQELPPASSVPPLRRGTNGQIEIAPPDAAVSSRTSRYRASAGASNSAALETNPKGTSSAARKDGAPPPKPAISVILAIRKIPDTTRS